MLNNNIKEGPVNTEKKYDRTRQKNIKNSNNKKSFKTKVRSPKVHFDISKHLRKLEHDVPEVDSESEVIPGLKTICDLDDTFYKVIEGRPIRQFVDVKVYMKNIRDITLYRANAAYFKDSILQIDTNIDDELKEYNSIYNFYNITKSNFFHFIEGSYETAKDTQQGGETKSKDLENKINELNGLSFMHVNINNKIGSLAAVFCSLFRYGHFLYQMSPIWWKTKNNTKNSKDFIKVFDEAESNPTQSFEIYKDYFIRECETAKIYFKKPLQLMRIFDNISRQCLNYMQIQCYTGSIVKPVLISRDRLENKISSEMDEVTDIILFYEEQLKLMEEKEEEYKTKFHNLLFNDFYKLYASYNSTKLFTCVQFIHFRLFQSPEDPRDKITTLVSDIEHLFVTLTSGLDYLNQEVVKNVKDEIFSSDIKLMKRATRAQRILKECDILKKSLISSFEAPRYFNKKMSA